MLVQATAVVAVVALLVTVALDRRLPGVVLLVAGLAPALLQALILALRPRGDRVAPDDPSTPPSGGGSRWSSRPAGPSTAC